MTKEIVLTHDHVRALLFYKFNKYFKAIDAMRNICNVMGFYTVSYYTAKIWFQRFKQDNFNLITSLSAGWPTEVNEHRLQELIKQDPRRTTRSLAKELQGCHKTIITHLHQLGKFLKYRV